MVAECDDLACVVHCAIVISRRSVLVIEQIPTAILGFCLFESRISRQMWEFMAVSMLGGFLYSYAKLQVSFVVVLCFVFDRGRTNSAG